MAFTPRKSSPRLKSFAYEGRYAYALTLNVRRNASVFVDRDLVEECRNILLAAAEHHGFIVLAYCFMPSHLHLLIAGSDESRLIPFAQRFKQLTGYHFKARYGQPLWQRSFHDHVLRGEEDIAQVAEYIWNNPVRAGLVTNREEYPYSGPLGQT